MLKKLRTYKAFVFVMSCELISMFNDLNNFEQKPLSGEQSSGISTEKLIEMLDRSSAKLGSSCRQKVKIFSLSSLA